MFDPFYQTVTVSIPDVLPTIATEDLILRPVENQDAQVLSTLRREQELFTYKQVPKPYPAALFATTLTSYYSHPWHPDRSIRDTVYFMNLRYFIRGPTRILGLSFFYVLQIKPIEGNPKPGPIAGWVWMVSVSPVPEIAYSILPLCFNRGLMTQALKAVLDIWWTLPREPNPFKLYVTEPEYVHATCVRENVASRKVLEKCGFEEYKEEERYGRHVVLYRLGKVFLDKPVR